MKLQTNKSKHYLLNTLSIILLFILTFTLTSCNKVETIDNPIAIVYQDGIPYILNNEGKTISLEQYDGVANYFDTYISVKKDNKYGFIKHTGEQVTKIKYDQVGRMSENKAVVVEENKTYIINNKGETLYTFKDNITSYSYFSENKLIIEKDGLLGYLEFNPKTSSFSVLVEPQYAYADLYHEGFATVGMNIENKIKYNYLTTNGSLFLTDFIFDEASSFSCGLAKVGTYNFQMQYSYLKNTLTEDGKPQYLTNSATNQKIVFDYAESFVNNIAFVAENRKWANSTTEDTEFYRYYSIVDNEGNLNYENELFFILKESPKTFFPHSQLFIDDVLIFANGVRSAYGWQLYRYSSYIQESDNGDVTLFKFEKAIVESPTAKQTPPFAFNLSDQMPIIRQIMEENDWTYQFTQGKLTSPSEINEIKYSESFGGYIASVKIQNDKMGIIKIYSVPFTTNKGNSLDTHQIKIDYIIPTIYDKIIY